MESGEWIRIGKIFNERRIELSYTRENIFELTHISSENIKLIEDGDLNSIPQVYMTDFLNRYSRVLSINPKEIISLYNAGLTDNSYESVSWKSKKRRNLNFKPLTFLNFLLLPVLFTIMILQFIRIADIAKLNTPEIINAGSSAVEIEYSGIKKTLENGESFMFSEDMQLRVINPSENQIVVKYNNKLWNVSLKEFEVCVSDG